LYLFLTHSFSLFILLLFFSLCQVLLYTINTNKEMDRLMQLLENEKLNLMYEYAIGTSKNELARMVEER
ncbi:MAG: hypothetical protein LUF89_04985, partial [Ruminococcus sp.]|nr:hypothetical protein [Ruminococcus sp.]